MLSMKIVDSEKKKKKKKIYPFKGAQISDCLVLRNNAS